MTEAGQEKNGRSPKNSRHPLYAAAVAVSLLTVAVYLPVLRNDFVIWDDDLYILNNQHIREFNLDLFRWAFTDSSMNYWHPLAWISHAADYAIWGLNPAGHHLTSILVHALNTFLVTVLMARLMEAANGGLHPTGPEMEGEGTAPYLVNRTILIAAVVTGILFGIHPIHVESVAWVSERKDLLCALFFLLSILVYTVYAAARPSFPASGMTVQGAGYGPYALALLLFFLALGSKPMAVTLPAVLLLLDWYPLRRIQSGKDLATAWIEKIPFIALALIVARATYLAQKALGAVATVKEVPPVERILVPAQALIFYLGKMAAPIHLVPLYPEPEGVSFSSFKYVTALVLVCLLTAAAVRYSKKQRLYAAVWGSYVVMLLPVIGIVRTGSVAMADRFTYLPSIGPFILAGLFAARAWTGADPAERRSAFRKVVAAVASVSLVVLLTVLAVKQIALWRNSVDLWNAVIEKAPLRVPAAYFNRGLVLARAGQLVPAMEDFSTAILLDPGHAEAYMNRGVALGVTGRYREALEDLTTAIELKPTGVEAYLNRAVGYESIGRFDLAIEDYSHVLDLNPAIARAYYLRGVLYLKTGRKGLALRDYEQACSLGEEDACNAERIGEK